jgi:hypothetical protein
MGRLVMLIRMFVFLFFPSNGHSQRKGLMRCSKFKFFIDNRYSLQLTHPQFFEQMFKRSQAEPKVLEGPNVPRDAHDEVFPSSWFDGQI